MTQIKHTPGPWEAVSMSGVHGGNAIMARSPEFKDEEQQPYHPRIATAACMRGGPPREIAEANARLIAAAPELLEVLEKARSWISNSGGGLEAAEYNENIPLLKLYREITSAIAKAGAA